LVAGATSVQNPRAHLHHVEHDRSQDERFARRMHAADVRHQRADRRPRADLRSDRMPRAMSASAASVRAART